MQSIASRISNVFTRLGLDEANASSVLTSAKALVFMNAEVARLSGLIRSLAPELFVRYVTTDVEDGDVYYLPSACDRLLDVRLSDGQIVRKISFAGPTAEVLGRGYERRGTNQIVFHNFDASDVEIRYMVGWPSLHYGTLSGVDGSGNPILPATPTAGTTITTDDVYNEMTLYLHGGTGAGQILEVKDYTGSTRTVEPIVAPSVTPDATSEYSILPPLPEHFHDILELGVIQRAPYPEWRGMFADEYNEMLRQVVDWSQSMNAENADFGKVFDDIVIEQHAANLFARRFGKIR